MLPSNRERTPIDIPKWLTDYADKWPEAGASAVVLYGSRSCGLARPDSDWDIAVLFDGEYEIPAQDSVCLPGSVSKHHEVCTLSCSISDIRPSLVREIARGVVLKGDLNLLIEQSYEGDMLEIDRKDMMIHLYHGYGSILQCIRAVNITWQDGLITETRKTIPLAKLGDTISESLSAHAAERIVKALCCALVIPYERTHNVEQLAKEVPVEWQESVLRLNGTTGAKQQLRYSYDPIESLEDSLIRIEHTLELANKLVESGYFTPNISEEKELQSKIYKVFGSIDHGLGDSDCEPRCEALFQRTLAQLARLKELALIQERENPNHSETR